MRTLLVLSGLLATTVAHAEIRFINGTDQPLTIDVLHADKQTRDIKLPVGTTISPVYGTPLDGNKEEMVVVRDASGKELIRQEVQTDGLIAINRWGDGLILNYCGRFQGRNSEAKGIQIINATGKTPAFKMELADFSVRENKGREPRDSHQVTRDTFSNIGATGQTVATTIEVVGMPPLKEPLEIGGSYHLLRSGDTLSLERIR